MNLLDDRPGDLVVFDLETTGLSPRDDEIIQIAALRIIDGHVRPADAFFSYVRPDGRISPFITRLTGITNQNVSGAPTALETLRAFSEFCRDSLLVAHNGHAFDVPFLKAVCGRARCRIREVPYIDSMHLSWKVWGRGRGVSHSLDHVVSRLCVPTGDVRRHDARGDVQLLAQCVLKLFGHLEASSRRPLVSVYPCELPAVSRRTGSA